MARPARSSSDRPRILGRVAAIVAGAVAFAIVVSGCQSTPLPITPAGDSSTPALITPAGDTSPSRSAQVTPTTPDVALVQTGTALAQLATLAIKGRAPKTGYSRAQFGAAWTDNNSAAGGHNGCDTRNDILRRDLVDITLKPNSNSCTVLAGTLQDPYTAKSISFTRGVATSSEVQIDHVVALSDAWQKGAQQLSPAQRIDLANDPLELLAVDGRTNQAKGDGDAATWLPPNKSFRCTYVARQVAVKARYQLWVTQAEHDAIARILAGCPSEPAAGGPLPDKPAPGATSSSVPAPAASTRTPTPSPIQTRAPAPAALVPTDADTYYANCSAVRAAGQAPLHRGEPGYRAGLDRDNDGVACE